MGRSGGGGGRLRRASAFAAADAASAAAYVSYAADDAATARQRLVAALTHAPSEATQWLVAGEYVLSGASVWTGEAWVAFGSEPAHVSVALDAAHQEAA